ncbi:DUF4144 domain-containing protein [Vibrio methylphosphonaticus]|uniref:DUF4144 domain-containing protein n=1 Tax=Vibrio methylphosphonaticus TaxID=2946866 RepID=UPI00202A6852|nr:DUF4144 domain-containing protein [Vibrio methylphosphonaticus]MCL9773714.1 DUF4144 domain-containing protein [Vibrio methylphosphonaticus]
MIQWPCVFKLDGDYELMFIGSESMLASELESLIWSDADQLIDSVGQGYIIRESRGHYAFEASGELLSLTAITQLIQEHEFSKAEMCLTKIQFTSVQEAIQSLAAEQ